MVGIKWLQHYFGVTRPTVRTMIDRKLLNYVKIRNRMFRFDPTKLFVNEEYNRQIELDEDGLAKYPLVDANYVCKHLDVAIRTVYTMAHDGKLNVIWLIGSKNGSILRFDRDSLFPEGMDAGGHDEN